MNALLTKATDEIAYEVAVKLAAAKASYSRDGTVDPREARKVRLLAGSPNRRSTHTSKDRCGARSALPTG